ncbi:hypothetical protein TNCV_3058141 [Trichonephila clavipes]|nr:hypothetical protein TNCV_3058141 [Trichonephila clavipes]
MHHNPSYVISRASVPSQFSLSLFTYHPPSRECENFRFRLFLPTSVSCFSMSSLRLIKNIEIVDIFSRHHLDDFTGGRVLEKQDEECQFVWQMLHVNSTPRMISFLAYGQHFKRVEWAVSTQMEVVLAKWPLLPSLPKQPPPTPPTPFASRGGAGEENDKDPVPYLALLLPHVSTASSLFPHTTHPAYSWTALSALPGMEKHRNRRRGQRSVVTWTARAFVQLGGTLDRGHSFLPDEPTMGTRNTFPLHQEHLLD